MSDPADTPDEADADPRPDVAMPLPGADDDFGLSPRPSQRPRPRDPLLGVDLGGVRIEVLIGEGGMGRVYRARQLRPDRTVAVKVMRPGMIAEAALRRFEHEAALLAKLQHPGIAQIHLVGTYESAFGDVPFYVMEHVADAKPITGYVRDRGLALPDRLALFATVCDAVAHGHERGVVHRDLKPGNILVDGEGRTKVIDYGVARSVEPGATFIASQTRGPGLVGTLQYMAPEQFSAGVGVPAIDARADVWALGVVLHELACGEPPHQLDGKALHEASRIICEEEPRSLRSRDKSCPKDLSMIVDRCLRKAPGDRYADAGELAADVRRHLSGEPLLRASLGVFEALRRAAQRNRRRTAPALAGLGVLGVSALLLSGRESGVDPAGANTPSTVKAAGDGPQGTEEIALPETVIHDSRFDETEIIGKVGFGYEFGEVGPEGGHLVGVRVSTGKFGPGYAYDAVGSIQPVYRTRDGLVQGRMHGPIGGPVTDLIAKDGYAVSGMVIHAPNRSEGIRVIFARVRDDGSGLDPTDTYESETYLNVPGDAPTLSTEGRLAVGLRGWWARDEVRGLGFYVRP
jgi:hypothetical protein